MFEGFEQQQIKTSGTTINLVKSGSGKLEGGANHINYSKRAMAQDQV